MRSAILIATLLLMGCNRSDEWEKQEATLANELNAEAPASSEANAAGPAANQVAGTPAANDVNAAAADAAVANDTAETVTNGE